MLKKLKKSNSLAENLTHGQCNKSCNDLEESRMIFEDFTREVDEELAVKNSELKRKNAEILSLNKEIFVLKMIKLSLKMK